MNKRHAQRGVTSIEMAFGVSIAGVILVFTMYTITQFIHGARDVAEKTQALYLAEDGLELVRYVRDQGWSNISSLPINVTRYLNVGTSSVAITTTPETVNGFTRSFRVQNVYRDTSSDAIVASTTSGSAADTDSKYVFMTVSWGSPVKSVELTTILTDISP